jgi:hypothetical protein
MTYQYSTMETASFRVSMNVLERLAFLQHSSSLNRDV